jgi:catechol 2,3-dioxygenase-like lactoylglutathione lyase family enzyme
MISLATEHPARHPNPTAKASALAYVIFDRPDLAKAEKYLIDFGLRTVSNDGSMLFMRGTASAPYCYVVRKAATPRFVGIGLEIESMAEFQALARLPGASPIEPMTWPGGGRCVHFSDPSGFRVDAVFERSPAPSLPHRPPLAMNSVDLAARVNETQRPPLTPPDAIRIGHVALELADFQATSGWYARHFGFIPSDVQVLPDGSPAVAFMRLDRGDTPADHHSLALAQTFAPALNHVSFEVIDTDSIGVGHRLMRDRGCKPAWGPGRHFLGSQIFDYWHDPWGDKHEHYCDGDLFTSDYPTGLHPASREGMAQWGQAMPRSFTRPKLAFSTLAALIHALRHSPDVTPRKLLTLLKLFG